MSAVSLHTLTIPTLTRALNEQINFLKKGEKWCEENNVPKEKLLEGKLAEDMKPLPFQIQRASDAAKAICSRLVQGTPEAVSIQDDEKTFPDLYARLQKTIDLLNAIKPSEFKGPEENVHLKMGPMELDFTALKYIQNFLLPNFWFHQTTAYLILRNAGVPVGKQDFLGAGTITQ